MQNPNVLEQPEYPDLPQSENDSVGSISRDETVWMAGIIDGEGCIHFRMRSKKEKRKLKLTLRIEIGSASPYMIKRISEIWTKMNFSFQYVFQKTYKQDYMRIIVSSLRGCQKVLAAVRPFLTAKAEEADLVLNYIAWRLSSFPLYVGRQTKYVDQIQQRFAELKSQIDAIKNRRFSFQRLPRIASRPLDLTNLEVVV